MNIVKQIRRLPVLVGTFVIRAYQCAIRPHLAGCCKFHPTCSEFACEAIDRFGVLPGGLLAVRRVLRCLPFVAGGYDPVPEASDSAGG